MALLLVSFVYAIHVVFPATTKTELKYGDVPNDFFCAFITARTRNQYRDDVIKADDQAIVANYLNQVYTLAVILNEKYHGVKRSS